MISLYTIKKNLCVVLEIIDSVKIDYCLKIMSRNTFSEPQLVFKPMLKQELVSSIFSLKRPRGRFSLLSAMSISVFVCVYVCAIAKHPLPGALETSG